MSTQENFLKKMRTERNMTIKELSELSGVPEAQIRRIERTANGSVESIAKLALALRVSPNKMLSGLNEEKSAHGNK